MKKILSVVLCLAMILSMGTTAFAADINTDGGSHEVLVSYGMAEGFMVTIPTNFTIDETAKATAKISASDVMIAHGSTLKVAISGHDYVDSWELVDEEEANNMLTYTIGTSEGASDIVNGSIVLNVASGEAYNSTVTETMYFTVIDELSKAGSYKDTLTFTVFVDGDYESGIHPWANTTISFVGDSITYGRLTEKIYWEYLKEDLNLTRATALGVSGSTISTAGTNGTSYSPLINRYQNLTESDLMLIFMGTNDYGYQAPLGTIEDTTDGSFYGALNVVVPGLLKEYPYSRVVFVTPISRKDKGYDVTLEDYVDAIKEVCNEYSVPVIDLYTLFNYDANDTAVQEQYMPDGLHPNAAGHEIIADLINAELRKISPVYIEGPDVEYENEMQMGNQYIASSAGSQTVISLIENIYLEKGTIVNVKDAENYNYGIYNQNSINITGATNPITGGWVDEAFEITKDGWYGIVVKRLSGEAFNLRLDSKELYDYVTITAPDAE